ncbi:MAG: 1-deoxy-D-xylulose-5-phosphate reductoisomerase [Halomonadaceae bacterium]|nr:MAG: 1-deoxy-D-xylulose-5-phosphate reductoisomerase [Halomonadaceae bacterium]
MQDTLNPPATAATQDPQAPRQQVTLLGATGSIGTSTLDVIARHPGRFQVYALTAHSQVAELARLCFRFRPAFAVISNPELAPQLTQLLQGLPETTVLAGSDGLQQVVTAPAVDTVMAAIVGAAGLAPTLAAVHGGKRVLLANKEALVMSGGLFMDAVRDHGATLLPIDSEHNAIFQCLPPHQIRQMDGAGVTRILLTASGGPFREMSLEQLETVTPDQACAHPNWSMGRKISVDSATLMNKGLELIEACWLFNARPDQIQVHVHPESIIHSMVEYRDGSVLAQLGSPDMRTPIANALAWPERIDAGVAPLDLFALGRFNFEPPDEQRFPCLGLAAAAFAAGGTAPAVLNAANEIAVAAFLEGQLGFTGIPRLIETVLGQMPVQSAATLASIMDQDQEARDRALGLLPGRSGSSAGNRSL